MKNVKIILVSLITVFHQTVIGQYDRNTIAEKLSFNTPFEKKIITNYLNDSIKDAFQLFLAASKDITQQKAQQYYSDFESFIQLAKQKRSRYNNDRKFFQYLFYKVHRKYLKHYQNNVTLDKLFEDGNYDCVSGTAFYALILHRLNVDFYIHETNYHIYLLLNSGDDQFLYESTDPLMGFVSNQKEIKQRISEIQKREQEINQQHAKQDYYHYKYHIDDNIDLIKLVGLQYFNLATVAYNEYDFTEAYQIMQKGILFNNTERMQDFMKIILLNHYNAEAKNNVINKKRMH